MHKQSIETISIVPEPVKRGRPKGTKDRKPRAARRPLPEASTCEVCGTTFKPNTHTQRFCSQVCYHQWWNKSVRQKATKAGIDAIKRAIAQGNGPVRNERGQFHAEVPGPRSRTARTQPPVSNLEVPAELDLDDEVLWAQRGEYWGSIREEPKANPSRFGAPPIERKPLVLNGHGIRLRVHQGTLLVRNGFTHYPQDTPELRFFPGDKKLPSRIIILLDSDGSISFDVITWLSEQRVLLVVLNWQGEVVSIIGEGSAYDSELRARQLEALTNGVGLELAIELIRQKIAGCKETLRTFWKSPLRNAVMMKLDMALEELAAEPSTIDAVRLIEGRAALAYFTCWQEQPITWKGTGRKPIPQDWHRCGLRQGLLGTTNRHATHPVNAMLNYAYAVLESEVRTVALTEGFDPSIGYLHAMHPGRMALVYDLMEPLRPVADRQVLQLVRGHTFSPGDFLMTDRGVCRLHPQLSRSVATLLHHPQGRERIRFILHSICEPSPDDSCVSFD